MSTKAQHREEIRKAMLVFYSEGRRIQRVPPQGNKFYFKDRLGTTITNLVNLQGEIVPANRR